jgi:gentisate 1,2-dioxygenase
MEKVNRRKILRKIEIRTKLPKFKENEKYKITWTNLNRVTVSIGSIITAAKAKRKFIVFKEDKLDAPIIIPLQMITDFKKIK